ncbi:Cro/CI family transcriptional regulator [Marinobacterium litorale]|uniref:Cro/CI family transcriptional regulator n=1 Tax=Marinobacterium litorale TaxID=404770 RepID=UPI00040EE81B|nr:Cro/CI family transcriptional regulator [Marinobacterium litorale]
MKRSEAIQYFDGIPALAKALGITYEAVRQWPEDGIPPLRQFQIQVMTNGELKADLGSGNEQGNAA